MEMAFNHARKLVTTSAREQLTSKKEGLARSLDHVIGTSMHANMVGTLVVAKVKVAIASIVKDDRKLFEKRDGWHA